jgi:hypothetical protein
MDIERFFPTGSSKVTINVHGSDDVSVPFQHVDAIPIVAQQRHRILGEGANYLSRSAMKTPYVADPVIFQRFGYKTSDKACKQIAKKGCCEAAYRDRDERLKKDVIFNMLLVANRSDDI